MDTRHGRSIEMRILVVGAGAIGGYFGGRLLEAGRDVTFLVRPRRASELAQEGLVIKSPLGDVVLQSPPTVLAGSIERPFGLVLLSCKAYDLPAAMDSFAAAVGPGTIILPLLNGMRHLDLLSERFGRSHLLGGHCLIAVTRDPSGAILHLNDSQTLSFGELDGASTDRIRAVDDELVNAGFDAQHSDHVVQGMWDKWVFLATLAGITCLMRASIGDIVASAGGEQSIISLLEECRAIAEGEGHAPAPAVLERARGTLTASGSSLTASMLRDLEANAPVEADHIVGDLLQRRRTTSASGGGLYLLSAAYTHLKAYELRRARQPAPASRR
jgi:2-dehydropantoate 2-reductase